MELEVTLERSDYAACQAFIRQSAGLSFSWRDMAVAVVVGAALVAIKRGLRFEIDYTSGAVAIGVFVVLFLFFFVRARSRLEPDETGVILGPHRYITDDSGFLVSTPNYEARYNWSAITSWPETRDHIFVKLDRVAAIIVPKRAFADASEQREFREELDRRSA